MKRLLSLILLLTTTTLACAQGKLEFCNNIDNLIYFTTAANLLSPGDASKSVGGFPLAGSSAYTGAGSTISALTGNLSFVAALYGGTSAGSLTLQTTTTIGGVAAAGQVVPVNVTFASLPAGTPAWFQIEIWDSRAPNPQYARVMFWYEGSSAIFQATPQADVYAPIYQSQSPVNSTWAPGTFVPVDFGGFPGYYGGIAVGVFYSPEPGTFALVSVGIAALMIYRRRR